MAYKRLLIIASVLIYVLYVSCGTHKDVPFTVLQILASATALVSWDTQIHLALSVEVQPTPPQNCSPGRNMGLKWTSGPCEYINILLHDYYAYTTQFSQFTSVLIFQRREHVCNVDRDASVHRGALQSPSSAPEDGRQGDEPPTSLTVHR